MADYASITVSPGVIFNIAAILVTIPVVVYTYRQPLKKRYHYFFFAFIAVFGLGYFTLFAWSHFSDTPETFLTREHVARVLAYFSYPLLYGFVAYFIRPKLSLLQKYVLAGSFAGFLAFLGLSLADPNFLQAPPVRATVTGYVSTPGNLSKFLAPHSIDVFPVILSVVILGDLSWFYRSNRNSLPEKQFAFLSLGIAIILFNFDFAGYLNRTLNFTGFSSILWAGALAVLLVGIRRHGFYGVTPVAETSLAKPTTSRYSLQEGRTYLAREYATSFEAFAELVKSGYNGLCITRTFPEEIRKTYGLQTTPVRWLAEERRDDAVPPTDLLGLSLTIKDFINKAKKPVVVLEGIEYLVRLNGFYPILRLVDGLNEAVAQKYGILLLPVLPNALEPREDALLAAETAALPTRDVTARSS